MLKIGHRGAPGFPRQQENTISSFEKAIWCGVDAIELDVRMTHDKKLAVIHDSSVNRTTNGSGAVSRMTFHDLSQLDAGGGQKIPLLDTVLRKFKGKCFFHIEVKEKGLVKPVLDSITMGGLSDSVVLSCFDKFDDDDSADCEWQELALAANKVKIGLAASHNKIRNIGVQHFIKTAVEMKAFSIHPQKSAITPSLVRLAHDNGLRVYAWTVNHRTLIWYYKLMGVDGIFSDRPWLL